MSRPLALVRAALSWPVASQERSRRKVMVASTALAERRGDRVEAEEFLARHARRRPEAVLGKVDGGPPEVRAGVI